MRIYILPVFMIYITAAQVGAQEDCPYGWQTSRTENTWPCYLMTNKVKRAWGEAQDFCTQMGGSLLKIDSPTEMNWVFKVLKAYHGFFPSHTEWWIGMHDNPAQKGLVWIDRSVPNVASLPWSAGEPTQYDHNKACVEYNNGTLRHQDCSTQQFFVCKRPRESPIWCDRRHGWENLNNKCYKVTTKLLTYDDARAECQRQDGDLLYVDGASSQEALYTFVESRRTNMWIGLRFYNTSTGGYIAKWNGPHGTNATFATNYWGIPNPGQVVESTQGLRSCVFAKPGVNVERKIWNLGNCSQRSFSVCQKAQGQCASGWIRNSQTCYALNTGPQLSWRAAKSYCSQRGAELIHIASPTTQLFVNRNLPIFHTRNIDSIWIGLSDVGSSDSSWVWANGNKLLKTDFNNTNPQAAVRRPGFMNCFTIFTDDTNGTWQVAANCSTPKNFLCNLPLRVVPKLPTTAPPAGVSSSRQPYTPGGPVTTAAWSTDCGPFWVKDATSGYCYQISDSTLSWAEAQQRCREQGANLASITSYHEERFIADRLFGFTSPALWIGTNSLNTQRGYEWVDGAPMAYFNWADGEPNNAGSNEHCGEFITASPNVGKWNDINCYARRGFICKRKSTDFSTIPPVTVPQIPVGKIYGCPDNSWRFYGGSCFLFVTRQISWSDANNFCQTRGFNLASIADENEQNFVFSQLPVVEGYRDQFWLGFSDSQMQMNFRWTDGSPVTYTNWDVDEPNNYQDRLEDCVTIIQQTGTWNDEACESLLAGFVCKTPRTLLPSTTPQYNFAQQCSQRNSIAYGYKCFQKITSIMGFNSASQKCLSLGGQLAVIQDKYEQAFLASQVVSHSGFFGYFWIGLSHDASGKLRWINNVGASSVGYTAWSANHTGNDNTSCVAMGTVSPGAGLWVDLPCYTMVHYLCEYPRPGYSTQLVLTTTQLVPATCPTGWSEYRGYCYKAWARDIDRRTWVDARDYCRLIGADLVSLHSHDEENFVFSRQVLGSSYWSRGSDGSYWIGLNDFDTERSPQWTDGTSFNYTNWGAGEPNDADGMDDCVEYSGSNWNDNNCYIVKRFVCKFRKGDPIRLAPLTTPAPPNLCADYPGWKQFNDSCYYFSPRYGSSTRLTWYNAQKYCLKNGAHLASVHSEAENNFLVQVITTDVQTSVWLGMNDLGVNQFGWTDGTPFDYIKWSPNEPNDYHGQEHCGQLTDWNGYWNDNDCGEYFHFVCKKPKNGGAVPGTVPTTPMIQGGCPAGFMGVPNGNKCYQIIGNHDLDQRRNYTAARDVCVNMGHNSDLASISNHQEQAELLSLLVSGFMVDNSGLWLGLNDRNNNFRFTWQDNSPLKITNWAKGEPRRQGYCVEMFTDSRHAGTWNTITCDSTRAFVCETFRDPAIPNTTPAGGACRRGYTMWGNFDCYKVQPAQMTWQAADASCQKDGAHLTSVMSTVEQGYIDSQTYYLNSPVWIGLGDPQMSGTFLWQDNFPVIYTSWAKGEPTYSHGEHCVSSRAGYWNDTLCNQQFPSVCKIPVFPQTQPTKLPAGYCKDSSWKAYGSYCYLIVLGQKEWKTYSAAESDCTERGMHLLSVMGKNEETIILTEIDRDPNPNDNVWIGFSRRGGFFQWSDGNPTSYMNWQQSGPGSFDCVYMKHLDGRWADKDCSVKMGYVCKTSKLPPTSPPSTTTTIPTTTPPPPPTTTTTTTTTTIPSGPAAFISTQAPGLRSTQAPGLRSTQAPGLRSTQAPGLRSTQAPGSRSPQTPRRRFTQAAGSRPTQAPMSGPTKWYPQIPQPQNSGQSNKDLSGGAVAGIVIGVLVLLALVAGGLIIAKNRSGSSLFSFKLLRNPRGFDNAAYDKRMDSVKINGSVESSKNGHANGSVGFQDFDHDAEA